MASPSSCSQSPLFKSITNSYVMVRKKPSIQSINRYLNVASKYTLEQSLASISTLTSTTLTNKQKAQLIQNTLQLDVNKYKSDSSIIAQARLVKRGVEILTNPRKDVEKEKKALKSKFNIDPNDSLLIRYSKFFQSRIIVGPPTPPPKDELKAIVAKPPFSFDDYRSRRIPAVRLIKYKRSLLTKREIAEIFDYFNFKPLEIKILQKYCNKIRIYLRLRFYNGNGKIVSTSLLDILDIYSINQFLTEWLINGIDRIIKKEEWEYDTLNQQGKTLENTVKYVDRIFIYFYVGVKP